MFINVFKLIIDRCYKVFLMAIDYIPTYIIGWLICIGLLDQKVLYFKKYKVLYLFFNSVFLCLFFNLICEFKNNTIITMKKLFLFIGNLSFYYSFVMIVMKNQPIIVIKKLELFLFFSIVIFISKIFTIIYSNYFVELLLIDWKNKEKIYTKSIILIISLFLLIYLSYKILPSNIKSHYLYNIFNIKNNLFNNKYYDSFIRNESVIIYWFKHITKIFKN